MSSGPDLAPAYLVSSGVGLALAIAGAVLAAYPRGVSGEWMAWLYVHLPSRAESSEVAFAKAIRRYRVYGLIAVVIGALCLWSNLSSIVG